MRFVLAILAIATALATGLAPASAAPPDESASFARACRALAGGGSPVCERLETATATLTERCRAMPPGTESDCDLFAGDLGTLIRRCEAVEGRGGPACTFADTFAASLNAYCRQAPEVPPAICGLADGEVVDSRLVDLYRTTWVHRALTLQRELGDELPLRLAQFPATHNSYNFTDANTPPTLSGSDPNQTYSLIDQLRMDMRGLELDLHWFPSSAGGPETNGSAPILCHGNSHHAGCTTERHLREGLREIRRFLDAHPDAVIVIDLEDNMNEPIDDRRLAHDTAAAIFEAEWGDIIYKPAEFGGGCRAEEESGLPMDLSPSDIRAAGKQVIMYAGCGVGEAWAGLFYSQANRVQTQPNSYEGFGFDGGADNCFIERADYQSRWTRMWEDRTFVGAASGGAGARITPEVVREMMGCGLNMPSLDLLTPGDPRLAAFVWSWAENEPGAASEAECALHNADGRFEAEACQTQRPFACRLSDGGWHVTTATGPWSRGPAACRQETAGDGVFAVPRTGFMNERLKQSEATTGKANEGIWLNYHRRPPADGWQPGGPVRAARQHGGN